MVLLIIHTIVVLILSYGVFTGEKYAGLCEPLESGDHPLKAFYTIGFSLSAKLRIFKAPKKLHFDIRRNAVLLYGETYADYHASAIWAQFLSLTLLITSVILLFANLVGGSSMFFLLICAVAVCLVWNESVGKPKQTVRKRAEDCNAELPNAVGKLALLINSGMILREAWRLTATGKNGQLYELMRRVVVMMDNGSSDVEALYQFGVLSDSQDIKKFSSAVIQNLEKGGGNLADHLMEQASSMLEARRQELLRQGEVAAGKLIAPIGIMFLGVMVIVIAAALQNMSF